MFFCVAIGLQWLLCIRALLDLGFRCGIGSEGLVGSRARASIFLLKSIASCIVFDHTLQTFILHSLSTSFSLNSYLYDEDIVF